MNTHNRELHWRDDLQRVIIGDETVRCSGCEHSLSFLSDYVYDHDFRCTPTYREELCKCRNCGKQFILHHDLFDENGHIYARVFTGDVNNPNYNWQDLLTNEQRKAISDHLYECKTCQDRLTNEVLTDAWFSSLMNDLRKRASAKKTQRPV